MAFLQRHKRLIAIVTSCVLLVSALGSAFFITKRGQAAQPTAVSNYNRVVSTGTNTDVQHTTAAFVRKVNLKGLPKAQPSSQSAQPQHLPYLTYLSPSDYAKAKAGAKTAASAPGGVSTPLAPVSTVSSPSPSLTFQGQSEVNATPPDMGLASGNNFVVQFVNTYLAVYTSTGTLAAGPTLSNTFFGVPTTNFQSDPRVVWDSANGRFIATIADIEGETNNNPQASTLYIAVSATNDPTGSWTIYKVNTLWSGNPPGFTDFPNVGIDANDLYYTGNIFGFGQNGKFQGSFVEWINLKQLEASQGGYVGVSVMSLRTATGSGFSVAPAITYGQPRAELLVSTDPSAPGYYYIWSISNPDSAPAILTYVRLGGPGFSIPPAANQPNNGAQSGVQTIDTGDERVASQPVYRNGVLYFAFTTGYNNGSTARVAAVRWMEVNIGLQSGDVHCTSLPNTCADLQTASIRDTGLIGYTGTYDAYNPALAVDADGNFLLTYSISATTAHPYVAVLGRRITTPPGQINSAVAVYGLGATVPFYSQFRWGDYSAAVLDPTSCTAQGCYRIWFSNMYVNGSGNWATTISADAYDLSKP